MALTAISTGSLYPGNNAKSIYKYQANTSAEVYTVPSGRILHVSAGEKLAVNGVDLPVMYEGGLTSDNNVHPFWATQGDVIKATTSGARLVGIEFDA